MIRILVLFLLFNSLNSRIIENKVELDWREKGAVLPVPQLNICKHASVLNAVDAISAMTFIKTGKLLQFSMQQIYDCGISDEKWCPCGYAGNVSEVFKRFGKGMLGFDLDTEENYPFTNQCEHNCYFKELRNDVGTSIQGWHITTVGEADLYKMLEDGPVPAQIEANYGFKEYTGGIFDDHLCSGAHLNHTLLVVGYGTEDKVDYWIARNNWGQYWGEEGYIRIVRDKNMCGIGTDLIQPIVNKIVSDVVVE